VTQRPLSQRLFYRFWWSFTRFILLIFYRVRIFGERLIPRTGGVLVLANHQSHFDPPTIGSLVGRRLNYVARKTLFKGPLAWFISMLDAIPIDQEGIGLSGIKETLKRLKGGEGVLLFPEGSRSWDGEMMPLMPGFTALVRRCRVPIVPAAIVGAHEAWPRGTPRPVLSGMIIVEFGPPLSTAESALLNDEQLIAEIDRRIRACFNSARARRRRALHHDMPLPMVQPPVGPTASV
jgi:1-acyl-sn-glycerol-3-phosphate acyltransferase